MLRSTLASRLFCPAAVLSLLMLGAATTMTGCTSGTTLGSTGTVTLTRSTAAPPGRQSSPAGSTPTSISPTPVTPNGLLTGAGVSDTTITLGLLIDSTADRGFADGVALWARGVNLTGGICGRTIGTESNRSAETLSAAYLRIAGSTLGLITLPAAGDTAALDAQVSADQIPALTLSGSSTELTRTGPVVVGATQDILTINGLAYLRSAGRLPAGSVLGTVTDGSPAAANALAGARWWAARNGVTLDSRSPGTSAGRGWSGVGAVLVLAGGAEVRAALTGSASTVDVLTDLSDYPSQGVDPGGRLLVTVATAAYGSDNPGAAAVAKAFVASGRSDPGPNLLSGYGVAAAWGRLLARACSDRSLTHAGVRAAMRTIGPASVDSLFGPSDPGLVVTSALPATRVSSVALADPAAPAGLRPLVWLQAAPDIADYVPGR